MGVVSDGDGGRFWCGRWGVAGVALQLFEVGSAALNSRRIERERSDCFGLARVARAEIEEVCGNVERVLWSERDGGHPSVGPVRGWGFKERRERCEGILLGQIGQAGEKGGGSGGVGGWVTGGASAISEKIATALSVGVESGFWFGFGFARGAVG